MADPETLAADIRAAVTRLQQLCDEAARADIDVKIEVHRVHSLGFPERVAIDLKLWRPL